MVTKNTFTQAESDVTNAQLYVRISGNNFDYWNVAKNEGNGVYSVPIPNQFKASSPTITKDVADYIMNALDIACFSSCDGCPSFAATLQPFCLQVSAVPYLGPLCTIATSSLIFLCEFGGDKIIAKLLSQAFDYYNEHMAPDEAALTIWAEHFQFGKSTVSQLAMSEVRFKNTTNEPFVAKLTYTEIPVVGNWNFRFECNNSVDTTFD